jgi:hypothetical protein
MSVIHVFIKQLFRASEKAPPPPVLCRRWGSNGSFQPEAVRLVIALKLWGLGLNFPFHVLNMAAEAILPETTTQTISNFAFGIIRVVDDISRYEISRAISWLN